MTGTGACLSSTHSTGSCQALSAFPAPREGSSLRHRRGQDCQSPEVSGAVLGDQAGPWVGTHPQHSHSHVGLSTDPGGDGSLTLLLPGGSCWHRPSPPVGRGTGVAGGADLSCHRHTTDGASIWDLAQIGGTTTALGDTGSWTARTAWTTEQTVGWTDRQSSPACMALTVYFCLAGAVLPAALGIPSGALLPGLGAVQPVLGDGAGIARPHQVHALGAQVDTVVLVWGEGDTAVRTVPSSGELPALAASTFPLHPRARGYCRERGVLPMPRQP